MTIFRSKPKPPVHVGYPQRRELWLENIGSTNLVVMLEPWCTTVEVPPKQWAKLEATFEDEKDEFHVQYEPNSYLGVYCPPDTTVDVIADRWSKK